MDILNQPTRLEQVLKKHSIREKFDTKDLQFRLLRFQKGEYLASPNIRSADLMFLLSGSVQIYGIREDGSLAPVAVQKPPAIFGDVEFASGSPTPFFAEAQQEVLCAALPLPQYEAALRRDAAFLNMLVKSLGEKFNRMSLMETEGRNLEERLIYYLRQLRPDGCIPSVNEAMVQLHCSRRQLQRVLARQVELGVLEKLGKGSYRLKPPETINDALPNAPDCTKNAFRTNAALCDTNETLALLHGTRHRMDFCAGPLPEPFSPSQYFRQHGQPQPAVSGRDSHKSCSGANHRRMPRSHLNAWGHGQSE